jgi:predicted DNA-binding protein YlxM (UPF0122 family)
MKDELIQQLEDLMKEEVTDDTFIRADDIKNHYLAACEEVNNESLQSFIAEGGLPENFEPKKDLRDSRFSELLHIFADREHKFRKIRADEVVQKQKEKEHIIESLEKLISEETNIGKAFHAFKELQARWNEIGNVPTKDYKNLQSVYHRHVHNFYYNMKLSKDLRELDFKRNHEQRSQLLMKIESLLPMESAKGMERMINLYRMEWSEMGPTAPETIEPLRTRYRELIGQVFQKIRAFNQELQKEEQVNLETKRKLVERAKGIAEENFDTPKQWQTMTDTLKKLFDDWKATGPTPKSDNEKVWTEFRGALNTFYSKKKDFFTGLKKVFKENRDRKLRIIARADEISQSPMENVEEQTRQIIQLQQDWKNAGHIEQWEENKLWKKFRESCDAFFSKKRERFQARDADHQKNLELKEELISRVEAFQPQGNKEEDLKTVRAFSEEWKTIQHVPIRDKQRIWDKFRKALDDCYDKLKLESSQKHLLKFRSNVESLSQSEDSAHHIRREKNAIRDRINKLQATINQYENNLGFFRNSKDMGPLLKEVESNLGRAREEMELLQKKLKMFSEVSEK